MFPPPIFLTILCRATRPLLASRVTSVTKWVTGFKTFPTLSEKAGIASATRICYFQFQLLAICLVGVLSLLVLETEACCKSTKICRIILNVCEDECRQPTIRVAAKSEVALCSAWCKSQYNRCSDWLKSRGEVPTKK